MIDAFRNYCWVALALVLPAGPALAHSIGVSRGEYRASGTNVRAELIFARGELALSVPGLDDNQDRTVSAAELAAHRDRLAETLIAGVQIHAPAGACTGALDGAALTEQDGLAVRLLYRCPQSGSGYTVQLPLLSALSAGHRHLAAVGSEAHARTVVVYEAQPQFELAATALADSAGAVGWSLFRLGIEHILTGYDHLTFLLGLILVGGRLRSMLVVITAFTVAHSITLGLAVGILVPSPRLVEPAIALSIAYVGIENWFVRDAARRWRLTFPFGLIHGFGFAGALQEIALPQEQIPLALVSFNAGVEAGQLAVLAIVLPALLWVRRQDWFTRYGIRPISSAIAVAGIAWFVARVSQ